MGICMPFPRRWHSFYFLSGIGERGMAAVAGDQDEGKKQGPHSVTFPDARPQDFPSLKLEVEDSSEGMSPRNMWQVVSDCVVPLILYFLVYALGSFLVLRWVWARWRERKGRGDSSSVEPSD